MNKVQTLRLHALDAMRGVFALSIVLWHYRNEYLPFPWHGQTWYDHLYLAVDFFFCLSGFVIALNYSEQFDSFGLRRFLKKRFIRIYPLLLYSTLVYGTFRIAAFIFAPTSLASRTNILSLLQDFFNTTLLLNSTPILGITHGMNVPTWSISAEFIAYLLFAILATTKYRIQLWCIVLMLSAFLFHKVAAQHDASADFGFIRGILGFGAGVLLHAMTKKKFTFYHPWSYQVRLNLARALTILMPITAFLLADSSQQEILKTFGAITSFSITIILIVQYAEMRGNLLSNRITKWLGDISYSVYLNHLIVIIIYEFLLTKFFGSTPTMTLKAITLIATLTTTLLYSHWTRKIIEKKVPLLFYKVGKSD